MRHLETELALMLVLLVCGFFAYRFKLRRIQNIFKERSRLIADEQVRSIEVIKDEISKKGQSGGPTSLTVLRKDTSGTTSKEVFTNIEDEIGQLNALEQKTKDTYKSGGAVRIIMQKESGKIRSMRITGNSDSLYSSVNENDLVM